MSIKKQVIRGVRWTTVSSLVVAVLQVLQLIILAHFLSPSDFGLMALVSVVIGFSALFMDFGISAAIIHRQDITHIQLSSLYWLNVAAGAVLFAAVVAVSPYVAGFYDEPELTRLIRILAVTFIITGFGNQYAVLLQKELQFDLIAKIQVLSVAVSFAVSIVLAAMGYGVYALVYATLLKTFLSSALNIAAGIRAHRPGLAFRHREIGPMLSFGLFQMGERTVNYVNLQIDTIIIGKLLGVEALGIYNVAKNLALRPAQIINPVVTRVAFPVMAKVQDDIPRLRQIYLKTVNYLGSVNFPVYILIALTAEPLIGLLFGERWHESVALLQILSFYGALRATGNPIGSLQLARGRADLGFYWNVAMFLIMPVVVYLGSLQGIDGVAYALVAAGVVLSFPGWYYMVSPLCGAGFYEYFKQIGQPLLIALFSGAAAWGSVALLGLENRYGVIALSTLVMGLATLALNRRFNPPFIETLLELLGRKIRR